MMDILVFGLVYMAIIILVMLADGGSVVLAEVKQDHQPRTGGLVSKSVVNSKMRLIFLVGLEGSGHHYFRSSLQAMFKKNVALDKLNKCELASAYYLTTSMTASPSTYAEAREQARTEMRALALQGEQVALPGSIALLTGNTCRGVGELSYPSFGGLDKVQQYIDVRMLAEMAEAEGVDLRLVYLKRSARDMVIADTQHRRFQNGLGNEATATGKERFMNYMRVLFTDIAVMHSGLAELGPGFIVCHDFGALGDAEQTNRIVNFIGPNEELAIMIRGSLLNTIEAKHSQSHELMIDDSDAVVNRLQQKLDMLELQFCGQ